MRLIKVRTLRDFAVKHADAASSIVLVVSLIRAARWTSMNDVLGTFRKAKILNAERFRLEIAGNTYRLICAVHFGSSAVYVKFIGTHAEYDAVDALTVSKF